MAPGRPAVASGEPRGVLRSPAAATVLVIFLVAAGLALLLANVDVPSVSVAISVEAEEVRFSPARQWEITDVEAKSLRITGDGPIVTPRTGGRDARAAPELLIEPRGGVAAWSASFVSDYLALNARVPPDNDVRLVHAGPSDLRIEVVGEAAAAGRLDFGSELTVGCGTACTIREGPREEVLTAPTTIVLNPAVRELEFRGEDRLVLGVGLAEESAELGTADDLQLRDIDFRRSAGSTRASAISGESRVMFPTLSKADVVLSRGDALHIVPEGTLVVRRMYVDGGIHVELLGRLSELATGPPAVLRSRMPTLLEYVLASQQLQLILGAVSAVAGLLVGILHKLGYFMKR